MKLRNRVAVARLRRRLSKAGLARQARISRQTLAEIERDEGHEPTPNVQAKIAQALQVRVDDLFYWVEPEVPEPVKVAS